MRPARPSREAQQPCSASSGSASVLPGLPLRALHAGVSRRGGRPRVSPAVSRGRRCRRGRDGRAMGALPGTGKPENFRKDKVCVVWDDSTCLVVIRSMREGEVSLLRFTAADFERFPSTPVPSCCEIFGSGLLPRQTGVNQLVFNADAFCCSCSAPPLAKPNTKGLCLP